MNTTAIIALAAASIVFSVVGAGRKDRTLRIVGAVLAIVATFGIVLLLLKGAG